MSCAGKPPFLGHGRSEELGRERQRQRDGGVGATSSIYTRRGWVCLNSSFKKNREPILLARRDASKFLFLTAGLSHVGVVQNWKLSGVTESWHEKAKPTFEMDA